MMDSIQRIVSRQFNDLAQKRQSTQLKSTRFSDDFSSSFDEQQPVSHSIGTREYVESDCNSNQFNSNQFNSNQFNSSQFNSSQFAQQSDIKPIKKLTNKLKKTFRPRDYCKKVTNSHFVDEQKKYAEVEEDECNLKSKTMFEKIRNIKESVSSNQIPGDLSKLYKQAKIIDVRNGKIGRRTNNTDNQNLLMFEELDNSH